MYCAAFGVVVVAACLQSSCGLDQPTIVCHVDIRPSSIAVNGHVVAQGYEEGPDHYILAAMIGHNCLPIEHIPGGYLDPVPGPPGAVAEAWVKAPRGSVMAGVIYTELSVTVCGEMNMTEGFDLAPYLEPFAELALPLHRNAEAMKLLDIGDIEELCWDRRAQASDNGTVTITRTARITFVAKKGFPESTTIKVHREEEVDQSYTVTVGNGCVSPMPPPVIFGDEASDDSDMQMMQMAFYDRLWCGGHVYGWEYLPNHENSQVYFGVWQVREQVVGIHHALLKGATEVHTHGHDHEVEYVCPSPEDRIKAEFGDMYGVHYGGHMDDHRNESPSAIQFLDCDEDGDTCKQLEPFPCEREVYPGDVDIFGISQMRHQDVVDSDMVAVLVGHTRRTLALRPILDPDFTYTCGCGSDMDCQHGGDHHMICLYGQCQCRPLYVYLRNSNRCVTELAHGKKTWQRSTHMGHTSNLAVDLDDDPLGKSCSYTKVYDTVTHSMQNVPLTKPNRYPWLVVDLGYDAAIHSVRLTPPAVFDDYLQLETEEGNITFRYHMYMLPGPAPYEHAHIYLKGYSHWMLYSEMGYSGESQLVGPFMHHQTLPAPMCSFEKEWDRSQGHSTGCPSIGGSEAIHSLYNCKAATKASNGNAFNWKDGKCYYKRCEDVHELQLTRVQGGWDVYALHCDEVEPQTPHEGLHGEDVYETEYHVGEVRIPVMSVRHVDHEVMLFKHASSQLCLDVSNDGTLILSDECHTMFFYDLISHTVFDTGSGNALRAEGSRAGARIRVEEGPGDVFLSVMSNEGDVSQVMYHSMMSALCVGLESGMARPGTRINLVDSNPSSSCSYWTMESHNWYRRRVYGEYEGVTETDEEGKAIFRNQHQFYFGQPFCVDMSVEDENGEDVHTLHTMQVGSEDVAMVYGARPFSNVTYHYTVASPAWALGHIEVLVSKELDGHNAPVSAESIRCVRQNAYQDGILQLDCEKVLVGRYVTIAKYDLSSNYQPNYLSICDMSVFGTPVSMFKADCVRNSDCHVYGDHYLWCDDQRCVCREGFHHAGHDNDMCVDVNECLGWDHGCSHRCENVIGSYKCVCPRGMVLDFSQRTCIDENECDAEHSPCEHMCTNIHYGYRCSCYPGYELLEDRRACADINECKGENKCEQDPKATCSNTLGSYQCLCPYKELGVVWEDGQCTAKDAESFCDVHNGLCEHECHHHEGQFFYTTCSCWPKYKLAEDRKSCLSVSGEISVTCDNNNGGCMHLCEEEEEERVTCHCYDGYELLSDHRTCHDINECEEHDHKKGDVCAHVCVNTPGAYKCLCAGGAVAFSHGRKCISPEQTIVMEFHVSGLWMDRLADIHFDEAKLFAHLIISQIKTELEAFSHMPHLQLEVLEFIHDDRISVHLGITVTMELDVELRAQLMIPFADYLTGAVFPGIGTEYIVQGMVQYWKFMQGGSVQKYEIENSCDVYEVLKYCMNEGFCEMEGAAESHDQGEEEHYFGPGMAWVYDGTGYGNDRKKRETTVGEEPHVTCICPDGYSGNRCEKKEFLTFTGNDLYLLMGMAGILVVLIIVTIIVCLRVQRQSPSQRATNTRNGNFDNGSHPDPMAPVDPYASYKHFYPQYSQYPQYSWWNPWQYYDRYMRSNQAANTYGAVPYPGSTETYPSVTNNPGVNPPNTVHIAPIANAPLKTPKTPATFFTPSSFY